MKMRTHLLNGPVVSLAVALGLGSAACDRPESAESAEAAEVDDESVSGRNYFPKPSLLTQVRFLLDAHDITPMAAPPAVTPEMFALGEALFYDKIMSGSRDVACATCHAPQFATADARPLNSGINGEGIGLTRNGMMGGRHTQPLFNLHLLSDGLTVDGKVELIDGVVITLGLPLIPAAYQAVLQQDIVFGQAVMPQVTHQEMRGFPDPNDDNELGDCSFFDLQCVWDGIMVRIKAIPEYEDLFTAAFPNTPWADISIAEVGVAIGSYEYAAFHFADSPWDRFVAGDDTAISTAALRGARFFFSPSRGNCVACHSGNALTDGQYHKTLTPQFGPGGTVPAGDGPGGLDDFGRMRNTLDPDDKYAWRTPPLRNVELTAPYGRLGHYTTLEDFLLRYHNPTQALQNYDITQLQLEELHTTRLNNTADVLASGVDPLLSTVNLHWYDVPDLIAFLETLTDDDARDLNHLVPTRVPSGLPVDH